MAEKQQYSFKIRRIEDKTTNTEKIEGQELFVLQAEEATEGIPKMRLVSDMPFNLKAGAHIRVTIEYDKMATELAEKNLTLSKDQTVLDAPNPVTGGKRSDDDMKKDLSERKAELAKKIPAGERREVKRK